jgi:hypothetical protein
VSWGWCRTPPTCCAQRRQLINAITISPCAMHTQQQPHHQHHHHHHHNNNNNNNTPLQQQPAPAQGRAQAAARLQRRRAARAGAARRGGRGRRAAPAGGAAGPGRHVRLHAVRLAVRVGRGLFACGVQQHWSVVCARQAVSVPWWRCAHTPPHDTQRTHHTRTHTRALTGR